MDSRRHRRAASRMAGWIAGQPCRARGPHGAREPTRSHLRICAGHGGRSREPRADRRRHLFPWTHACSGNLRVVRWSGHARLPSRHLSSQRTCAGEPRKRRPTTRRQSYRQLRHLGHRARDIRVPAYPLRHQRRAASDPEVQAPGTLRTPARNRAMTPRLTERRLRLAYAAATGAGAGSLLVWTYFWVSLVRGNLRGPDFVSFYAAARLYVLKGGSAVYDLALQKQFELQIIPQYPDRFIVLPYFHPPYYTLLIAPLAALSYRGAYYAMAAFNVLLAAALIVLLVRNSLSIHGRGAVVAAAVDAQAVPDEQDDQCSRQQDIECGHRVVGPAIAQGRKGRDEQRVVGRMEVREHDESIRGLGDDLQFELFLESKVVDGRTAVEYVEPSRCVKRNEVGSSKVAPDQADPEVGPDQQRACSCSCRSRVGEPQPPLGEARGHRPVSSRSAKRSGSLDFRIARCAPLMS